MTYLPRSITRRSVLASLAATTGYAIAQKVIPGIPNVGIRADNNATRTECGVGALMPWADGLYAVTYNSSGKRTGTGLGLYRLEDDLKIEALDMPNGVYANRFIHHASNQCIIGPYIIDSTGKWRRIEGLVEHRLTSTMPHLTDPKNRVYFMTMEGLVFEMDVNDLKPRLLTDLTKDMNIKAQPHFKGGYTAQGRVVVSNNGFFAYGETQAGLFEWDGKGPWKRISDKPHMDVAARENMGNVMFASGWDEKSVLFRALVKGEWQLYRLPKPSHAFEQGWQTEWMRIREVETEHYMMDIQGMFYELQPLAFEDRIWGVKPVCQHLRIIPDYCSFRGMLALGGNETTPNNDNNAVAGQPQSGIWFGKTDDLWSWGKPKGWGGPWRKDMVKAGEPSDPFLFTNFEHKMLHLISDKAGTVEIQIDFLGDGTWVKYETVKLSAGEYHPVIFPEGFSAQWARLVPGVSAKMTAEFMFT
ncbi:hypothetical protein [Terriglobus sp. RCC_193]|uniref:hypothetical protein n=1 Tax=Terriglobus sp. RCC_193 TaxID=3239218 RepID=UPI0035267CE3